jgi:hypothetical protein
MRYTEARLSRIAATLLVGIDNDPPKPRRDHPRRDCVHSESGSGSVSG